MLLVDLRDPPPLPPVLPPRAVCVTQIPLTWTTLRDSDGLTVLSDLFFGCCDLYSFGSLGVPVRSEFSMEFLSAPIHLGAASPPLLAALRHSALLTLDCLEHMVAVR